MPNLVPPVSNATEANQYRQQILDALAIDCDFQPLMMLYLTDDTSAETVRAAKKAGVVGVKLYPAGATTNSQSGVTSISNIYPALEALQELDMVFAVHGEVTHSEIDIFDREACFAPEAQEAREGCLSL